MSHSLSEVIRKRTVDRFLVGEPYFYVVYPTVARLLFMFPGLPRSSASFFVQSQARDASDTTKMMKRKGKFSSRAAKTCGYEAVPGGLVNRSPCRSYIKMWLIHLVSHPMLLN